MSLTKKLQELQAQSNKELSVLQQEFQQFEKELEESRAKKVEEINAKEVAIHKRTNEKFEALVVETDKQLIAQAEKEQAQAKAKVEKKAKK